MAEGGGVGVGFRQLGAWRYGMELAVRAFDVTGEEVAGDGLRLAALEIPQRLAAGALDGRPKCWARCVAMAQGAVDRLEAEARQLWVAPDARLMELVAEVRRELAALERGGPAASPPLVAMVQSLEVAAA